MLLKTAYVGHLYKYGWCWPLRVPEVLCVREGQGTGLGRCLEKIGRNGPFMLEVVAMVLTKGASL